jgi:hypothetical protein
MLTNLTTYNVIADKLDHILDVHKLDHIMRYVVQFVSIILSSLSAALCGQVCQYCVVKLVKLDHILDVHKLDHIMLTSLTTHNADKLEQTMLTNLTT